MNLLKEKILYVDIETVPLVYQYEQLSPQSRYHWDRKWTGREIDPVAQYVKAGIYAEFAKIVCIGYGYHTAAGFFCGSFSGHDEQVLLRDFHLLLKEQQLQQPVLLCAHNGKEFDFPFLGRRYLVNALPLPDLLRLQGKKPWEVRHIDTLELWKFGDYKSYSSLDLLAFIFDVPSPKTEMDGSQVASTYYEKKDLPRISRYCLQDVITLARVYARFCGQKVITEDEIIFA
jgi:predicted PolB exonuclease-like 3'-5' exonuclease